MIHYLYIYQIPANNRGREGGELVHNLQKVFMALCPPLYRWECLLPQWGLHEGALWVEKMGAVVCCF